MACVAVTVSGSGESLAQASPFPSCHTPTEATADLPGGSFIMGSNHAYREESPMREEYVDAFSIDTTEVTNAQFRHFVEATGYVTTAEKAPDPTLIPQNAPVEFLRPGSAVFIKPEHPGQSWWRYVPGANWRHPEGPSSSIEGKDTHPVVQISFEDAQAYADWKGRRLPSEAEWEYAARAGRANTIYAWGDDPPSKAEPKANTWQGIFPIADTGDDGYQGTAPVACYDPNPWGLYDMTGNVWEWTDSPYPSAAPQLGEAVMAIKGGSFLCAANFCARYRPTARQGQEVGLPTNHIGFRTAKDE
jgi:formylglycine-generating enzyme required for sulfatase activity